MSTDRNKGPGPGEGAGSAEQREGERSEPDRSGADPAGPPDPQVPAKATRRKFSAEYKLNLLRQADACTTPGTLGALLRREGVYSSSLANWRKQRDRGALKVMGSKKRGPRATKRRDPVAVENARLHKENARLKKKLEQAELVIDVQKKLSETLQRIRAEDESEKNA